MKTRRTSSPGQVQIPGFCEYDGGSAGSVNTDFFNNRVAINCTMGFILVHYEASI